MTHPLLNLRCFASLREKTYSAYAVVLYPVFQIKFLHARSCVAQAAEQPSSNSVSKTNCSTFAALPLCLFASLREKTYRAKATVHQIKIHHATRSGAQPRFDMYSSRKLADTDYARA